MSAHHVPPTRSRRRRALAAATLAVAAGVPGLTAHAEGDHGDGHGSSATPRLTGRAVLPVETYADGPVSGQFYTGPSNGITFPLPSQPVAGFSGLVEGRQPGEWLAMADNGYGSKASSKDFNIRAYDLRFDFTTARGGTGTVTVGDHIEFSDPRNLLEFPIVNEATAARVLTGADIDPESIQRGRDGTYWIGDEFGPWILHFDADGGLLEAPFELPGGLTSVNHPTTPGPVPNSGGFEAMAMSPDGRSLYAFLEKGLPGDDLGTRRVYEFDVPARTFTRIATYRADVVPTASNPDPVLIGDAQALDPHRLLLIERDNNGGGLANTYRTVYEVDLRDVAADGTLRKSPVLDMTKIPDPDLISLPAIHDGDVGLGAEFLVACESIEALQILTPHRLLLGCDNNFPNKGRNPNRADDSEFITVRIP